MASDWYFWVEKTTGTSAKKWRCDSKICLSNSRKCCGVKNGRFIMASLTKVQILVLLCLKFLIKWSACNLLRVLHASLKTQFGSFVSLYDIFMHSHCHTAASVIPVWTDVEQSYPEDGIKRKTCCSRKKKKKHLRHSTKARWRLGAQTACGGCHLFVHHAM